MQERPNAAKNNVLLPPCRSSVVCKPNLVQVYLSRAWFCRSSCCYNVRKSMLKPNKVLEAKHRQNCGRFKKRTTDMGRCKTLQEKTWQTGVWQRSNKENQLIQDLNDDCMNTWELSGDLPLTVINLLLSLIAHCSLLDMLCCDSESLWLPGVTEKLPQVLLLISQVEEDTTVGGCLFLQVASPSGERVSELQK